MTLNNKHKSLEIGINNRQAEPELDSEEDLEELESDVNKMVEKILEYRPTIPYQLKATLALVLSSQRPNLPDVRSELGSSGELNPGKQHKKTLGIVRTIFITGLPENVKERELQNLLRWLPGYEASQVNYKGEKPMGFALFSNARFAVAAKDALQFFEMPRHEAVQALDVYKLAGQQANSLSDFYDVCKGLELARNFQFPVLREVWVL
ncbi:hypothetical protein F3Y22_tig00111427pilonHSYRG00063 [Hibiscus syriacus]|uniref:AP180 N-terminal homology (ANTH) domain-containing protein n=1 Tax=Hibiscus syriacus TaxID=106335 RepID=A0A6A2XRK6_HIBSY|nr:hypothetical protein F3Y22_tig00111427pilonHSYRG00063 [Hibiscus syriacus]